MHDKDWIIELDKLDYQGYYRDGKKIVGRNHLLLIANGYIGVRGCFPELFNEKVDNSVHVIGIYDQLDYDKPEKDVWKEIINNPDFMSAPIIFDGEDVFLGQDATNYSRFKIWLNMRNATLTLQYVYTSKNGNRLRVEHNRFCAYHEKNLIYNTVHFTSLDKDCDLVYSPGISGHVSNMNGDHLENFMTEECEGGYLLITQTKQHKYKIAISSRHQVSAEASKEIVYGDREIRQNIGIKLQKDKTCEVVSQHTFFTSRDAVDPVFSALSADYEYVTEQQKHIKSLQEHWNIADVTIDIDEVYIDKYLRRDLREMVTDRVVREVKYGLTKQENKASRIDSETDAEVNRVLKSQLFMRYNLYILIASIPKDYDYAAIPSRSLSYQTYKGSIFWEVDTYAFPFYAMVFPDYAKNIMMYRYKCLEYAINKAADGGHEGAFFAWESLDTGEEATKKFVWQDIHSGRMMRNYFGDRQWHIAGDVIYAAWQYYDITGDWDFIEDYGSHMTLLTARFVASLVYYKVPKKRYEILHTTCPDEYHEEVANNTFTNRILRFALEKAMKLIDLMDERCPEKLQQLLNRYGIDEETVAYWQDIINKMYIIPPDKNKVIEQHEGYFELEDISLEEFKSRIVRDEYLGYPMGPATHTQIIKQADTIQMLVMFKNEYHPVVRKATFDYYDLRTEHGSGDSPNAYGIVAAQVGLIDRALWYFLRSARIDLESANPATKANFQLGGVHIAPPGGTWQVLHYGFLGFELDGDVLKFNPVLPKGWKKLDYNFFYQGNKIGVKLDTGMLELINHGESKLLIKINDQKPVELEQGKSLQSGYRKMGNHYYTYNELGVQIRNEMRIL